MKIQQTEAIKPHGARGYIVINDENLAIVKKISEHVYIVMNNTQQVFFLDTKEFIFELIID